MITVDRGVEFLDKNVPGWADKIDTATLDLSSACGCVLGQLYRNEHPRVRKTYLSYERKAKELGLDLGKGEPGKYGFMATGRMRYENLTAAWCRVIEKRRGA